MPSEIVRVSGHIIDSLILPKVLDEIMDLDGTFEILQLSIGKRKADPSTARLKVSARSQPALQTILKRLVRLGATPEFAPDVQLARARKDGVLPSTFYSTTNLPTFIRYRGRWRAVERIEMDCGIVVDPSRSRAICTPMIHVKRADLVVCGSSGVRVVPLERSRRREVFQFMHSPVSPEKPKAQLIAGVAQAMREMKRARRKILVVAGPALIHTGGGAFLERLIRAGWVDVLFAGNGLATHDIESALFGTALGVDLSRGTQTRDGHDHHMRAINTIRDCGGIRQAVRRRTVTKGVMHACVAHRVPYVLAGSIRDDGPLPDVLTDALIAQDVMRQQVRGVGLALMIASTLHAIATGNLLPATVKTVCVDINPAVVTKLSDRGTFQGIGIVSDAASFLRELCAALRL
ncbi:MAG TPA: TIGR00300 family protein [Candidatus Omnitrophica bacterium]|nr:TIGR00300 family protein [Candidatus Omnitrophota bacterium]HBQ38828.1 TIGR00300 family protein [Candidatus Omnitrophota bacterium]